MSGKYHLNIGSLYVIDNFHKIAGFEFGDKNIFIFQICKTFIKLEKFILELSLI